jgi:hypothetical protein
MQATVTVIDTSNSNPIAVTRADPVCGRFCRGRNCAGTTPRIALDRNLLTGWQRLVKGGLMVPKLKKKSRTAIVSQHHYRLKSGNDYPSLHLEPSPWTRLGQPLHRPLSEQFRRWAVAWYAPRRLWGGVYRAIAPRRL